MFEKLARRCSRRHKQTTFSDVGFLGVLREKISPVAKMAENLLCVFSPLNPSLAEHDMQCLSKQCRPRSVGFFRSTQFLKKPADLETDLDLHCLSLNM